MCTHVLHGCFSQEEEEVEPLELGLIQKVLPDEMLHSIFSHLSAYHLGAVACTCRQWRELSFHPRLWEAACVTAFRQQWPEPAALARVARTKYR